MSLALILAAIPARGDITNNLLAYYNFEGLAGTVGETVVDQSGNGHDLDGPSSHQPVKLSSGGPNELAFARFSGNEILRSVDTDVAPAGTDERVIFVGYAAEYRFGPLSRFVLGADFAANRVRKLF